jgi:hypothetical protein
MPTDRNARLDAIPRKVLAVRGETLRKPLADDAMAIGRVIERALVLAGLSKQDAAFKMGYGTNQAPLSRWIAGIETPQFAKLFALVELRAPLVMAFAESVQDIDVVTQVTIRRRAS